MLLLESRFCSMIHHKIQAWTQHCRLIGTKYIKVNNSKNWEQYKSKLQSFSTELKILVLPVNTDVVLYRVDRIHCMLNLIFYILDRIGSLTLSLTTVNYMNITIEVLLFAIYNTFLNIINYINFGIYLLRFFCF